MQSVQNVISVVTVTFKDPARDGIFLCGLDYITVYNCTRYIGAGVYTTRTLLYSMLQIVHQVLKYYYQLCSTKYWTTTWLGRNATIQNANTWFLAL